MSETTAQHAAERWDNLGPYVLVEHIRKSGLEFDRFETALDGRTLITRLEIGVHELLRKGGVDHDHLIRGESSHGAFAIRDAALAHYKAQGVRPSPSNPQHVWMSVCDRARLLEAVAAFGGELFKFMFYLSSRAEFDKRYPDWGEAERTSGTARKALHKLVADTLSEMVTVAAEEEVRITQGTAEGETPQVMTYSPTVPGAEKLTLSECAVTDVGARIEAASPPHSGTRKIVTVRNGLTGRIVHLRDAADEVKLKVRSKGALLVYASDVKAPLILSVEKTE